jgi:hypothetical protein
VIATSSMLAAAQSASIVPPFASGAPATAQTSRRPSGTPIEAPMLQQATAAPAGTDNRTAEIVAILGEIQEISREHRRKEEELREERRSLAEEHRSLANLQAALRADRAEISEARRQLEAERAEVNSSRAAFAVQRAATNEAAETSRRQATTELQAALDQERRKTEAQSKAAEAIQALYQGQIAEKDLELGDQAERAERRDRMREARIRELTQELHDLREAAATMTEPPTRAVEGVVEPVHIEAASTTRRRLSYSEEFNGSLLEVHEEEAAPFALQLDASQACPSDGMMPSVPPSTDGCRIAMSSDTRRRLSYSNIYATVGTQTPETPAFDPTLSEMAQRLFDSQLEVANSTIIGSTPGASGFPVTVVEPTLPIEELSMLQEAVTAVPVEAFVAPAAPASLVDSATPLTEQDPRIAEAAPFADLVGLELVELSSTTPLASHTVTAVPSLKVATRTGARAARDRAVSTGACMQRASSERPRNEERSPRSPPTVLPRRSESARLRYLGMSATPPRVQKESPPRGCVAEKVKVFEQRCHTPRAQTGNQTVATSGQQQERMSGAMPPEALRRGPSGVSVPTPTSAGAPAGAVKHWRAEADEQTPCQNGVRNNLVRT